MAGLFYPKNPQRLRAEVAGLMAGVSAQPAGRIKALIAPHAGYAYSGAVAAAAFAAVRNAPEAITRVVMIGPAHHVALRGIAVSTLDAFETPLGQIELDRHAIAALDGLPGVLASDAAHEPDHALEVELPFLQLILGSFRLVPLLVGAAAANDVALVLERLWGGAETLVVISSDLSHFLDYDTARRRDAETAVRIERGEWPRLCAEDACGFLPIAGLLVEAARRGLPAQRLALCSSGDTAGDRRRVVGYGAWIFAERGEGAS